MDDSPAERPTPGVPRALPWIRPHLLVDAPLLGVQVSLCFAGPAWAIGALGAALLSFHAWASMSPRSSWYLPICWRLPTGTNRWALTFDDGPHPEYTPRVLDLLAAHGHQATFFVIGRQVERNGPLIRRMRAEGHAIGMHSYGHSRCFNMLPHRFMCADLERCAAVIADATGEPPPLLFRPPVGLKSPQVADACDRLGLTPVLWSKRAWDLPGAKPVNIARRLQTAARPRAIVLLHDGHEPDRTVDRRPTLAALESALPRLSVKSAALLPDGDRGVTIASSPHLHGTEAG